MHYKNANTFCPLFSQCAVLLTWQVITIKVHIHIRKGHNSLGEGRQVQDIPQKKNLHLYSTHINFGNKFLLFYDILHWNLLASYTSSYSRCVLSLAGGRRWVCLVFAGMVLARLFKVNVKLIDSKTCHHPQSWNAPLSATLFKGERGWAQGIVNRKHMDVKSCAPFQLALKGIHQNTLKNVNVKMTVRIKN